MGYTSCCPNDPTVIFIACQSIQAKRDVWRRRLTTIYVLPIRTMRDYRSLFSSVKSLVLIFGLQPNYPPWFWGRRRVYQHTTPSFPNNDHIPISVFVVELLGLGSLLCIHPDTFVFCRMFLCVTSRLQRLYSFHVTSPFLLLP